MAEKGPFQAWPNSISHPLLPCLSLQQKLRKLNTWFPSFPLNWEIILYSSGQWDTTRSLLALFPFLLNDRNIFVMCISNLQNGSSDPCLLLFTLLWSPLQTASVCVTNTYGKSDDISPPRLGYKKLTALHPVTICPGKSPPSGHEQPYEDIHVVRN